MRFFGSVTIQGKFWVLLLVTILLIAGALFIIANSVRTPEALSVNLEKKSIIPPVRQMDEAVHAQTEDNVLRVAIAGVLSPTKTLAHYQELLDYLGQNLNRKVILIQKATYAEVNDLIRGQLADIAIICSLAYVKGHDDFGMELLVVPQINGKTVYYSYLIVPSDSNALSLEGLRGASFAFTDPISNSGHLAPTYQLSLLGETPRSFFNRTIYTYSHDNSIMAVANKLVDGAAVDSLVYDKLISSDSQLASQTRVTARWGPYGMPPLVITPKLTPQLKQQLTSFFLGLHQSDDGMIILNKLGIDKFVLISDTAYDSIRQMKTKLGW